MHSIWLRRGGPMWPLLRPESTAVDKRHPGDILLTIQEVEQKMPKTVSVLTRVSPGVKKKLEAIAKDTNRSESFLAAEAITSYVEASAWQIELIRKRLAKADSPDGRFVPHEEVREW